MKKEIIFDTPNESYRVVCRFGYDSMLNNVWFGHIQRRVEYKKWIIFGELKYIWTDVNYCWWANIFETREQLKEKALKFYDEKIELPKRVVQKAINL